MTTCPGAEARVVPRALVRNLLVALSALVLAGPAEAEVLLGVHGNKQRMRHLTGQRSDAKLEFFGWGKGVFWGQSFGEWFPQLGRIPVISLGTNTRAPRREAITPRAIARGKGDRYLFAFSRAIHRWGKPIIIRPMPEMNGHWNYYCAYNANGTRRGAAHSQRSFRRAFKRLYLILHGGDRATINRQLDRSGLPHIHVDLAENPAPTLRVLWNPQGYGSPRVHGNRAAAYYPGGRYVDIVGNDLYDIRYRYAWKANLALFHRYPNKPYAIGEFGLWGIDDPAFIRRIGRFIRRHHRVKLAVYFKSQKGSIFDLGSKPRSRAAYRNTISPLNR
jgi:hypothetical protein